MTIPTYLPYFVAAGTAAALIAILYGLNRALARRGLAGCGSHADVSRVSRHSPGLARRGDHARSDGVYHVNSSDRFRRSNMASCCRS